MTRHPRAQHDTVRHRSQSNRFAVVSTLDVRVPVTDAGSAEPVALSILTIPMLVLVGLIVIGARVSLAANSVATIAGSAARDASLARTPAAAVRSAQAAARHNLHAAHVHCAGGPSVRVDTTRFALTGANPASVTVQVTCVVALSDVGLPGLPGSYTITEHATSPVDPYRSTP